MNTATPVMSKGGRLARLYEVLEKVGGKFAR